MNSTDEKILFEKFEIIDCLKKDAYTGVYLANHIYLGKKIILKTLNTDNLHDKTLLQRFKREAKILAQLDHPNLIKVMDFGTYSHFFYISFEYFNSRNLREVFQQNNLSNENKLEIFIQLLKALNIAHQNQIIHRDIKPENILVDENYHLKIADFGLALIQNEENITQTSTIVGTPGYMSPEQLRGEKSLQTDLFSAGVVVYEMYNGSNPFSKDTVSDTINQILNYDDNSGLFDYSKFPLNVSDALKSMLRKNINQRAKSANEILTTLGVKADIIEPVKANGTYFSKNLIYYPAAAIIVFILFLLFFKNPFADSSGNSKNQDTDKQGIILNDSVDNVEQGKEQIVPAKTSEIDNNTKKESVNNAQLNGRRLTGRLFVECKPWADVYLDGKKVDTTPIKDNYIIAREGKHELKLINPAFPQYIKNINIYADSIKSISLDFKQIVGYFKCDIRPWGEVFINDESKGVSPIREPVALFPGRYKITVKNPEYKDHSEMISLSLKDTLQYYFNFESTK